MAEPINIALHHLDPLHPPVVLLGGLNLVRALGLSGLQAVIATDDVEEPALRSRYCTAWMALPPAKQRDARVDALASLGERLAGCYGRRVPLVYGSDDALEMVYAHRERLERFFLMLLSTAEVAECLIAKDRFQAFAESHGLPVPPTLAWDGDGDAALRAHEGEVVVKPRAKRDWHRSALCLQLFDGDGKARVFASGAEAMNHPVVAHYRDQLTFQPYIPGGDEALWSFHGFADESGNVMQSFTGRKIRTFPVGMGESAYIEMAQDSELDRLGREVAKRCPLRGFFKMDFKHDPRDGRWYLLEINARCTLWNYMGAANGVNLMRTAYDYLVERRRPAPVEVRETFRWVDLSLDLKACREMRAGGTLTWARWLASLARGRKLFNLFSWSDPGPWTHDIVRRVQRKVYAGPARFLSALRQWASTAS